MSQGQIPPEERERRGTEAYLAPRQANGFGAGQHGDDHPARRESQETRKLLKERLDDPIEGAATGDTVDGLRANLIATKATRVQAALMVLDDALCERTKSGRCTENAMAAARFIINHRFGRPKQAIEVESSTEEELLGQIDRSLQMAAATIGEAVVQASKGEG